MSDTAAGVVTVSYGSEGVLDQFLASLERASVSELRVVVADNSPDAGGPVRGLAERYGVAYLPMSANLGYGGAMNAAVAACRPTSPGFS